jgi:hypothetical protein
VDTVAAVSTALAAVAALLAAVSAVASWRSTRAVEADVELARLATRYDLFRAFESAYSEQYTALWDELGPWEDPPEVDPKLRRVVHDLLQTLSSIHNAHRFSLIDDEQSRYLSALFLDWLRLPAASAVWVDIFRVQAETWPPGFVAWLDARL